MTGYPWFDRLLVASCLLLGACGGSSDPSPNEPPTSTPVDTLALSLGDTVVAILAATDTAAFYRFTASEPVEIALFWKVTGGDAYISAGTGGGYDFSQLVLGSDTRPLLGQRSDRVELPAGTAYQVTLRRQRGSGPAAALAYRLFLYRVNRAPEAVPAGYTLDATLVGERFETSADIDEFTMQGTAGETVVAFLDAGDAAATVAFDAGSLQLLPPGDGPAFALASIALRQGALDDIASRNRVLATTGAYRLLMQGNPVMGSSVPYRFRVRKVQLAPEATRVIHAPGDTVAGERIDHIGDVDEFTVTGTPGQPFNIYFLGETGGWPLTFLSLGSFGDGAQPVSSSWTPVAGLEPNTGRIVLPASGQMGLRVSGLTAEPSERVGYRLALVPINRAPEVAPAVLAPGGSIVGEALEREGDLDEFTLRVPSTMKVAAYLQRLDPLSAEIVARLITPSGDTVWGPGGPISAGPGSGRLLLGPGDHRLSVGADNLGSPFVGSAGTKGRYRIDTYIVNEGPETAPLVLTAGVPAADAIDPFADRDTLVYDATAGQVVRLFLSVPGDPSTSRIGATLLNPAPPGMNVLSFAGASALGDTGPVEMPESRRYVVSIEAGDGQRDDGGRGPYTVRLDQVSRAPESVSPTVAPGQSVSESLEPYDIDDYVFTGAPNSELSVVMTLPTGATNHCVELLEVDSRTRVGLVVGNGAIPYGSGLVRLGADGRARASLWAGSPFCENGSNGRRAGPDGVSSYRLDFFTVNRAPELAAATITAGQTVITETLAHVGDVDEFRFSGTALQALTVDAVPQPGFSDYARLRVQLIAPDGSVLFDRGPGQGIPVTLPAAGTYTLRFFGQEYREGTGPYHFTLVP